MKSLYLRVWVIIVLTLALGAALVRLVWALAVVSHAGSFAVISLLMVAILATYALLLYLVIRPSLNKLRSLPVAIAATVIAGGGIIGSIIHFIRFVPSSNASSPLSVIVASMLLASGLVLCALVLWVVWRFRQRGKD